MIAIIIGVGLCLMVLERLMPDQILQKVESLGQITSKINTFGTSCRLI